MNTFRPNIHARRDLAGHLLFLGTGTSVGVPVIGCGCSVCQGDDSKNNRTRTSVALGLPAGTLLVDTTPDLRAQCLREQIGNVDAILFTHDHVDHLYGLDDIRPICFAKGSPLPLYCEERVERRIRQAFDYAFQQAPNRTGGLPKVTINRISEDPFELLGASVVPLRLRHGSLDVLGFRFGNLAYCTDTNHIPEKTWPLLENLDTLILDCLRPSSHPTHFSISEAIAVAERVAARRTFFIHMSHEIDYESLSSQLPAHIQLAYDGLAIPFQLEH